MQASLGCCCWIHSAEFWGWSTAVGTLVSSIPPWFSWEFSPEPQVAGESCWQLLALIFTSQSQSISVLSCFYFPPASSLTPGAFHLWWAVCSFRRAAESRCGWCSEAVLWQRGQRGPRALPGGGDSWATPSSQHSTGLLWSCHQLGLLLEQGADLHETRK